MEIQDTALRCHLASRDSSSSAVAFPTQPASHQLLLRTERRSVVHQLFHSLVAPGSVAAKGHTRPSAAGFPCKVWLWDSERVP